MRTSTTPAEVYGERPAADPLPAAGRPASLLKEVEALLTVNRQQRLGGQASAGGLRRSRRA